MHAANGSNVCSSAWTPLPLFWEKKAWRPVTEEQLVAFGRYILGIAGIFRGGLVFAVFAVGQHPRKFNPRIFHDYVLVLKLLSGYEIPHNAMRHAV